MAKLFYIGFLVFLAALAYCNAQGPRCGPNESWNRCGRLCEPSCENRRPVCPAIACGPRTAGCRCNRGFWRLGRRCVPLNQCPSPASNEITVDDDLRDE